MSEDFEDTLDTASLAVHNCQTIPKMRKWKRPNKLDLVMTTATLTAVLGAVLNATGNKASFLLWLLTNTVFLIVAYKENNKWMATVFGMYFLTSIMGLIVW